ncbi:sulfotransferase [Gilvimarinus algae]|uniref:Sulfotransferase n=1 Tax=Gilvimarinus algae TaxID=3058037 RepID=A0ABT8TGM0_9GAMM|nr:sulfotransferase [Gilvimarinus sp. SDUM040014]MDO3383236.1 sulfotransferase [Gilvimarinus sp. SDUM040014]
MQKQKNLKTLQKELSQALNLINNYSTAYSGNGGIVPDARALKNTDSLLERCAAVVDAESAKPKPILRIIHHFACSGGTLISKCLAAQPNVFLLSELHPTTRLGINPNKAAYTPRDITTQAIYGRVPDVDALAEKLFLNGIIETEKHIRNHGGYLVIRAHSHADYCVGEQTPNSDTISRILEPYFDLKHVVTVRNPVDSFLSLRDNGWIHFKPGSFDEYCERLIKFLESFKKNKIVKYEDFVTQPEVELKHCTNLLLLPYEKGNIEYIELFKVSGDSGRSGSEINPRSRKFVSDDFRNEVSASSSFLEVQQLLEYEGI